jgi:hypothetical protein
MAKLNKLQNPLGTYIILEDMGRGDHITAAFPQYLYLFHDILLKRFITAIGKKRL